MPTSPHRLPPPAARRPESGPAGGGARRRGPAAGGGAGRGGPGAGPAPPRRGEPAQAGQGVAGPPWGFAALDPRRQSAERRSRQGFSGHLALPHSGPKEWPAQAAQHRGGLSQSPKKKEGPTWCPQEKKPLEGEGGLPHRLGRNDQLPRRVHKVCGN